MATHKNMEKRDEDNRIGSMSSYIPETLDCLSQLTELGDAISLPRNYSIIENGEYTEYCYVVLKGRVISYENFPNGEERIYQFYEAGDIFLEESLSGTEAVFINYRTDKPTELCRIKKKILYDMIKNDIQLALSFLELSQKKEQMAMQILRRSRNYSVMWKICDVFCFFADRYGEQREKGILIRERFSQQFIANLLGVNRITAVRAMKELAGKGLIKKDNGFYYICDMDKLKEYKHGQE